MGGCVAGGYVSYLTDLKGFCLFQSCTFIGGCGPYSQKGRVFCAMYWSYRGVCLGKKFGALFLDVYAREAHSSGKCFPPFFFCPCGCAMIPVYLA